jgi:hypothetical protein
MGRNTFMSVGGTMTAEEIRSELAQYTGTEAYHKLSLGNLNFTDGVKAMAELCQAYWLCDVVASYQPFGIDKKCRGFQVWKLTVKGNKGKVECSDGDGKVVKVQKIEFTDFPLDEMILWVTNGVCLLPSEY